VKTSCVQHSKSERLVMLRASYLELCDHDHAAACLLAVFEYWHNVRLAQNEQERVRARDTPDYKRAPSQWIHKSYEDLARDLLGLYGRTRVITATQLLVRQNFLVSRSDPKNPNNRTKQYHFRPDNVNAALAARDASRTMAQNSELDDDHSEKDDDRSETHGGDRSETSAQRSKVNDVLKTEITNSKIGSDAVGGNAAEEAIDCAADPLPKQAEKQVSESEPLPETTRTIRERFPEADERLIGEVGRRCRDRLAARGKPPELATDELIAKAVIRCTRPKARQFSAALYLDTVPQCVETWMTKEERKPKPWEPGWLKEADEETKQSWRQGAVAGHG
jgi:hypothetical protein